MDSFNDDMNNNMDNMNDVTQYDDDGNPIPKDRDLKPDDAEPIEPEEPLPEIVNPLKFEQLRIYLTNLKKTFSGMSYAFTTFNCAEKELDSLCDEIGNFIHIRDVNISKNKFFQIKGFNNMKHLIRFDARENEIRDISILGSPNNFKFLQVLYLSNNKIKVLPKIEAENLIELHLDNNLIKNASAFATGLPKLAFINLTTNKLKDCSGLSNCPKLLSLKANDNEISSFKGMENLPKLVELELQKNQFKQFDIVPNLESIKKLVISENQVSNIKEFAKLKYPTLREIVNTSNPATDETGGATKVEMLILFEGYDLKTINEEEVTKEDIAEALEKKNERIRIAEEERILREQQEAERLAELEKIRIEEENQRRLDEEERLRQLADQMAMDGDNNDMNMGDHDMNDGDGDMHGDDGDMNDVGEDQDDMMDDNDDGN